MVPPVNDGDVAEAQRAQQDVGALCREAFVDCDGTGVHVRLQIDDVRILMGCIGPGPLFLRGS